MQLKTITFLSLHLIAVLVLTFFPARQQQQYRQYVSTIGGCQRFPDNNIWNYDISHLLVDPNSANYIANIGKNASLYHEFGIGRGMPFNIVSSTQSYVPIHFILYGRESDPGPYPIPPNALIENNSDHHVLVVDSRTCKLYELWKGSRQPNGSWNAGSGAVFNLKSNNLRPQSWTSADAAGLPILPGLVSYDEVVSGAIRHALRFAVTHTQAAFLWPARHFASSSTDPNLPPMGLRLRLKASVDISTFPPQSRIILAALQHYGMFVADNSPINWEIFGAPDDRWDNNDLASLRKIHGSDFEAVDESALQVSSGSAQVRPIQVSPSEQIQWPTVYLRILGVVLITVLVTWGFRKYRSKRKRR
jgi:hypothetical protein